MLVLSRKQHELIRIGQDIIVKVIRTGQNSVKIGIEAPSDLKIDRCDSTQPIQASTALQSTK